MQDTQLPTIDLLPLKAALPAGQDSELTLLIRVHPAQASSAPASRPPLNLSFVLDRSGSMRGRPIAMARHATQVALRLLQPHDRVSVVAFNDQVDTIVPPQQATDPEELCHAVEGICSRGSTALHAGWLEAALLAAQHFNPQAINRVLLLSNGRANSGETRAEVIAQHVSGLTTRGISTSTIGLGRSYDETLLQGMADAGDGNYEHIELEDHLPAFFAAELHGLTRTTGHTVSFGVEPNPSLGIQQCDLLNDLPQNALGRWQLANLIDGRPIELVVTLPVPAQTFGDHVGVTRIRLAWTDRQGVRRTLRAQLNLPVVDRHTYAQLPAETPVLLAAERLRAARVREEAVAYANAGNVAMSRAVLSRESHRLMASQQPALLPVAQALHALDRDFAEDEMLARKRATSQSYNVRRSKPQS